MINVFSILAFNLLFCFPVYACLSPELKVRGTELRPIAQNVILNGSSIEILEIHSNQCSIECYMDFLDKKNIHFSLQGTIFFIEQRGGITVQLFESSTHRFSGRMICKAKNEFRKLNLPDYLKLPKPSTDFQAADQGAVSRTLVYPNFKKESYIHLIKHLKGKSITADIQPAYAYFESNNGDEFNLIFDQKKKIGNLVIIYVNKRIRS